MQISIKIILFLRELDIEIFGSASLNNKYTIFTTEHIIFINICSAEFPRINRDRLCPPN